MKKIMLLIVSLLYIISILLNCDDYKNKDVLSLADYMHKKYDNDELWKGASSFKKENRSKIIFNFYNNPFGLKESDKLKIFLNEECVYDGVFKLKDFLYISPNKFGNSVGPNLQIKQNNIYYSFGVLNSFLLDSLTKELDFCFFPQNDNLYQFYCFQSKEETYWLTSKKLTIDGSDSTNLNK